MQIDRSTSFSETMLAATPLGKLLASVDEAVVAVLRAEFSTDDLFGDDLSSLVSRCASLQKRHGHLLQQGVAAALRASGRFTVLTNQDFMITGAAESVVASSPPEALERLHLRHNDDSVRKINLDLVVIEEEVGWAGAYDCKRGGGQLTQRLLRPLVRDLEATRLLLRSALRDRGYSRVDEVVVGIIDVYGASGAPDHLRIGKADLDAHFGTAVSEIVDLVTTRMRRRFQEAIAPSLSQFLIRCRDVDPSDCSRQAIRPTMNEERRPARLCGPRRAASPRVGADAGKPFAPRALV
jgi:hypothetical protein